MLEAMLLQQCAPDIDPVVAHAIVRTESTFQPFAIGVNKGTRVKQPTNYRQAVATAKNLLAEGGNIDLGLAQINSNNLNWLKLSVEEAFNPCANLRAMQTVYNSCYQRAGTGGLGNRMQRAFSCYNTGNMKRGFNNGYVNKTTKHFNTFSNILNNAGNQPSYQVSPRNQVLPKNGNGLADYASQLQARASRTNDQAIQNPEMDSSNNESNDHPFVASASIAGINSIPAQAPQKQAQSWDIFQDF